MLTCLSSAARARAAEAWARPGLMVFVSAFLWAPSQDGLIAIYALAFFIPMLLVLPWQLPNWRSFGGAANIIALALAVYAVASVSWSAQPGDMGYFAGVALLLMGWLYGVCWLQARAPLNWAALQRALLWVAVPVALSAIAVFYRAHPWSERLSPWTQARNPIVIAQTYAVISLLALLTSWRQQRWLRELGCAALALAFLAPVALSQSRGPILAYAVTVAVAAALVRPRWQTLLWQALAGLAGLALVAYTLDLIALLNSRSETLDYRRELWQLVWQRWQERPWLGVGLDKNTFIELADGNVFHHAHNAFVDGLYRLGLIGALLGLGHLLLVVRGIGRRPDLAPLYLWLLLGCLCLLTDGRLLFWQLDAKWFLYWVPAGLLTALQMTPNRQHSAGQLHGA